MTQDRSLKVIVRRPGAARSRLEALTYAGHHPCPACGRRVRPSVSQPADETMGGHWEVIADCANCGTVTRYIFERAPGWPGGRDDRGGPERTADPSERTPFLAASPIRTQLFSPEDLAALRDRALPELRALEAEQAARGAADPSLKALLAAQALKALRPMLELERFAAEGDAVLPEGHDALRATLASYAEATGIAVPMRQP